MRAEAGILAAKTHSALVELTCVAEVDVAANRIKTRRAGNSDVTPGIAVELAAQNNGWETAYRVDTIRGLDYSVLRAHDVWFQATHN